MSLPWSTNEVNEMKKPWMAGSLLVSGGVAATAARTSLTKSQRRS